MKSDDVGGRKKRAPRKKTERMQEAECARKLAEVVIDDIKEIVMGEACAEFERGFADLQQVLEKRVLGLEQKQGLTLDGVGQCGRICVYGLARAWGLRRQWCVQKLRGLSDCEGLERDERGLLWVCTGVALGRVCERLGISAEKSVGMSTQELWFELGVGEYVVEVVSKPVNTEYVIAQNLGNGGRERVYVRDSREIRVGDELVVRDGRRVNDV